MQLPAKETFKTGLIELLRALEDYKNPSNQHYTPQFGVSGGIRSVFQYTVPKAGPQQTNKPLTLITPIEQRALQERVL